MLVLGLFSSGVKPACATHVVLYAVHMIFLQMQRNSVIILRYSVAMDNVEHLVVAPIMRSLI